MFAVKSVDDLWDFIAYVLAYAPDFPHRDFLSEDQQLNLTRAFELLGHGIAIAYPEPELSQKRERLHGILQSSLAAYQCNDEIRAGHLLNEFQDGIFQKQS